MILLISLAVYLFSRAVVFEKVLEIETPDKAQQQQLIEEIQEKVE